MSDITPNSIDAAIGKYIITLDAIDTDLLEFKWYAERSKTGVYFARPLRASESQLRMSSGKPIKVKLHRIILARKLGHSVPMDMMSDHIDGNTLNNQRCNLRAATPQENVLNRGAQSNNKSGFKGVASDARSGKWIAYIKDGKKQRYLGTYDTPEAAYDVYCSAAVKAFGEFARLK